MTDVHVLGAGHTRFGRRDEPLEVLAREAVEAALAEAGHPPVDHVFYGLVAPGTFQGNGNAAVWLNTALGLHPAPATRVETAPSSGAAAVEAAWFAVKSGRVETALVVGAERMTGLSSGEMTRALSRMIAPGERVLGATMPALAALAARRYMAQHGLTREHLALVPVKAHAHGALNPYAHFQKAVSPDEVLASPVVADPLHVFDCAPASDGAAALVLSRRAGPTRIAAAGHATDAYALTARDCLGALTSFRATRAAAESAFAYAGKAPADVDVAEVHDAFSILELMALEDLGFFAPGDAVKGLVAEETSLGGRIPINPSGGLKARGHPLGASGVAQVVELHRQLTSAAGRRQVDGSRLGLAHSVGGFGNNVIVSILEAVR